MWGWATLKRPGSLRQAISRFIPHNTHTVSNQMWATGNDNMTRSVRSSSPSLFGLSERLFQLVWANHNDDMTRSVRVNKSLLILLIPHIVWAITMMAWYALPEWIVPTYLPKCGHWKWQHDSLCSIQKSLLVWSTWIILLQNWMKAFIISIDRGGGPRLKKDL